MFKVAKIMSQLSQGPREMPEKREKTIILMMINHVEKMLKL